MRRLYLLLLALGALKIVCAQPTDAFTRIRIPLSSSVTLQDIARTGVPVDHATILRDHLITVASTFDRQQLQAADIPFSELPLQTSPAAQQKESEFLSCDQLFNDTIRVPGQFNYGSMGDMLTYDELLAELDSMAMLYPNLITVKQAIDTFRTHENRPIYYVKISDNPNIDESGMEDQVLYTALHHAREPVSMMQLVFYMQYLLENYGSNEQLFFNTFRSVFRIPVFH